MELVTVAIGSLLPKLGELLIKEEHELQNGVKERVRSLCCELEAMHAALRVVVGRIPRGQVDEQLVLWAREVRERFCDMEDAVDAFLLGAGGGPDRADLEMFMRLIYQGMEHHQISEIIVDDDEQHQVQDIACRSSGRDDTVGYPSHDLNKKPTTTPELVGIDGPRDELIEMLSVGDDHVNLQSELKIVSIFGIGGLGKTTLAKAVYGKLKRGFQCGAFVAVGRNPDMNRVFREILYCLDKRKFTSSNTMMLDEGLLINELQKFIQNKRFLIIIDDLRDLNSWSTIRFALPNGNFGGKVVITTDISEVARNVGDVYELQPLSDGNSKKLLFSRMAEDEGKCVECQSAEATDKFLKKCGGVPLAIITVASLLASKPEDDWSEVYNSIVFGNGNNQEENIRRILSFCYYNLPSHLKTCLLYLSIFREDYEINKCLLIWKWIAEGFVHKGQLTTKRITESFIHEEQQIGLFELAEEYFNELINRSMIQPLEVQGTGYVIGCCVHDMILDLVRSLSTEENFVTVLSNSHDQQKDLQTNAHILAVHHGIVEEQNPQASVGMGHVRSFVAISSSIRVVSPSFRVLRVLALEDCKFIEGYMVNNLEHLGKLLHLRYLGLTRTQGFHELPEGIGHHLKFLQTLDLYGTEIEEVPLSVGQLTQLLCLRVGVRTRVPAGLIGNLTSLQELWIYPVTNNYSTGEATAWQFVKDLGKLTELRVLKTWIVVWGHSMATALVESLHNLHRIQCLELDGISYLGKGITITWEAGLVSSKHVRWLSLACFQLRRRPAWLNWSLFPNLSYLVLNVQDMQEEDMEILGRMPELCSLTLQSCNLSVVSVKDTHGDIVYFPKLRFLSTYRIMIWFDIYSYGLNSSSLGIHAPTIMPSLEDLGVTVHVRFLKDANFGFHKLVSTNLPLLQSINAGIDCSIAHVADVEEAEVALTNAVNIHPNNPTLKMTRYNERSMLPSYQTQQIYAITPINSTSSYVRPSGGGCRVLQAISSSLGPMGSLLSRLDLLLDRGCWLPKVIKDRMQLLKDDLEEVATYLEDLSAMDEPQLMAKCWMKEVRELSYDIEDYTCIIEDNVSKFVRPVHAKKIRIRSMGKTNHLKINGLSRRLKWNQHVVNMISGFRNYVQDAAKRYNTYNLHHHDYGHRYVSVGRVLPTPYEQTSDLVIDGQRDEYIKWLANDRDQQLKVVCIVGCGGIGKTTLAKILYAKIWGQFDCRAFIKVPQRPNMKRLFSDIISQVQQNHPPDDTKELDLIDNIRCHLQDKRYLIIIDDLWASSTWDILNQAFPECTHRSRIIITTQITDVALTCCSGHSEYIFEMKPLEDDYSRKLFFSRLFGSESDCPQQFKEDLNKIIQICGGFPLAINIIAGLLASQPVIAMELCTYVCKSLSSDFWTDSTSEGMRKVINLCYNNLPPYLKTCLLYLNMYPEGYIFCKDSLVKTWVAEGFMDALNGSEMEKVAASYFDELIGRGFIQPIEINYNDEVLSCIVHELVHDLIASKSLEENFIVVVDCYRKKVRFTDKVRRLSLHFNDSEYAKVPANIRTSQVRSLTFFGLFKCMPYMVEFKILRVLNLQLFGHHSDNMLDLTGISELFQLRYLKIACDTYIELPNQMGRLQNLETLDIDTKLAVVPVDVFLLPVLFHLHLLLGSNLMDWIGRATTLENLEPSSNLSHGTLKNIQDIRLTCYTLPSKNLERNMEALGSLLGTVINLKTLCIVSGNYKKFLGTPDATISWDGMAPPHFLQRFEWLLHGCIFSKVPKWIGELGNLCTLNISVREFVKNCVVILRGLPALTSLSLNVHTSPTEKIIFDKMGFSVLKYLEFQCNAPWLKFETDAMPNLRKLNLGFNVLMENIDGAAPISIERLPGIKEISAKIGGAGGDAQFALTSAVSNHPSNPRITVHLVDSIFYGEDDKVHQNLAMKEMDGDDRPDVGRCAPLDQVLENILQFLTIAHDRNTASMVCRYWYHAEAETRRALFVSNCYAVSPHRVIERFSGLRSITLKGRPRSAGYTLVPKGWGAYASPWVAALGPAYPHLERIFLKRMTVSDSDLGLIAQSFSQLRELSLVYCDGFSVVGLSIIAERCRDLRVLDLIEDHIEDTVDEVDWLSKFPQPSTALESLVFECVHTPCNFEALEALVARSPALYQLRVNHHVTVEQLRCLMTSASNLSHIGTGAFRSRAGSPASEALTSVSELAASFAECKSLVCLSGFRDANPEYLPAIYPICANLTSLSLKFVSITAQQLTPIISRCRSLQKLQVVDTVGDDGLRAVAQICQDLRVLQVYRLFAGNMNVPRLSVSGVGLEAISRGCRNLETLVYHCRSMTNAALMSVSNNCPHLLVFCLWLYNAPHTTDQITGEPMDEGFGAIVMNCRKLCRLSTSGLLTDKTFAYIGQYGKFIKTLSVASAGDTDMSLRYVFEGCTRLQKLEVWECPFGDEGLLSGLSHFCNMRYVWMSSCKVTMRGCRDVARQMPNLVVEVISGRSGNEETVGTVDHLCLYRSLAGPRNDAPPFVNIL